MLRSLENTGGKLAPSPTLATHVVYNPDNDEVETLAVSSNQVHVTKEVIQRI